MVGNLSRLGPLRRDLTVGSLAGLLSGLVVALILAVQEPRLATPDLLGIASPGDNIFLYGAVSALAGAAFGAAFRPQTQSLAATLSAGLLYGLLWWIVGPLTLGPMLHNTGPTWSGPAASAAFPALVAHVLYGGLTGFAFHVLATTVLARGTGSLDTESQDADPTRRILVLGGGFGGVAAAQRLEELFGRDPTVEITLVSQSNYLLFTPMLAEVASGAVEPQHISAPLRACFSRARVLQAEVEAILPSEKIVHVRAGSSVAEIGYEHLVLALGAVPNYYGLPGLQSHSFALKSLGDAVRLRDRVITLLERADAEPEAEARRRDLRFVVVGGGFAGTEAVAEIFDLARSTLRYYPNVAAEDLHFTLIHGGERLLPELSAELAGYALQKLAARGIQVILEGRVASASPDSVLLGDGRRIPTQTLVWAGGNSPNPLVRSLPCEHSPAGAAVVDESLRVNGLANVWAVGDCAAIGDPSNPGKPYPPTAQHALREGRLVAENIARALRGKPTRPFRFRATAVLVALGRRTAVAEIHGWKFSGIVAWLMWRTVYLSKLPGVEKKLRVALDWTIDVFFPRDIVLATREPMEQPAEHGARGPTPETAQVV